MRTNLSPEFSDTPVGKEAEAILRKCVHCGFCNATCPTYQLLGDELDGPRGRIYLMKQVLEGAEVTRATQLHLDRCLTCRACETTCPSGVEYGRLAEIGRDIVETKVARPVGEAIARSALRTGLTSRGFGVAVKLGKLIRPFLPGSIKSKLTSVKSGNAWPTQTHTRKVLLLAGCVQPSLMPNINIATARVLDAAGIQTLIADGAGCCGAIHLHLGRGEHALDEMRSNIDAWWLQIANKEIEAIVMNASGCGVTVKEYGRSLAHDPNYAEKARRVSELTRDMSELLPELAPKLRAKLSRGNSKRLALHLPCTFQHGQKLDSTLERELQSLGFETARAKSEEHLCCGSAGTYSILQRELSIRLRDRKLEQLESLHADTVASANIGCIQHLQSGTRIPVRHWVEILADRLG